MESGEYKFLESTSFVHYNVYSNQHIFRVSDTPQVGYNVTEVEYRIDNGTLYIKGKKEIWSRIYKTAYNDKEFVECTKKFIITHYDVPSYLDVIFNKNYLVDGIFKEKNTEADFEIITSNFTIYNK